MNSKDSYRVLLSFDLEEFDLPNEYGAALPMSLQLGVTAQGMEILEPALSGLSLSATFFTTAFYAQQHPAVNSGVHNLMITNNVFQCGGH